MSKDNSALVMFVFVILVTFILGFAFIDKEKETDILEKPYLFDKDIISEEEINNENYLYEEVYDSSIIDSVKTDVIENSLGQDNTEFNIE